MAAGKSKTSLIKKLGIKPGYRVGFENDPAGYRAHLGKLPPGVVAVPEGRRRLDFLQLFVTSRQQLEEILPEAKKRIKPGGMIWISWPKLSSPMAGDLKGGGVREAGLENGLVDVKVAAIDDDWSGLKFVYRKEDRPSI